MDSGLSFDAFSGMFRGEDLTLAAGGGRARGTGRYIQFSLFLVIGISTSCFYFSWSGSSVFFHHVSVF